MPSGGTDSSTATTEQHQTSVQPTDESEPAPEPTRDQLCQRRIDTTLRQLEEPADFLGDAARRANLLMRIKGEPVIFARSPQYLPSNDAGILAYRRWLERTKHPLSVLGQLYSVLASRPDLLRATLLRDGYIYAHDEALARALVNTLRVDVLFREPELWIQRGEGVHVIRRTSTGYVYTSGEQEGQPASILLFDRIGQGPVPAPLHLDLRSLRYRLHFDTMTVERVTADHVVALLRYGEDNVRTLLRRSGARLDRECELVDPSQEKRLGAVRNEREQHNRAVRSLQRAMTKQIGDALPFDEPKRERGQEDGKLRPIWTWAYTSGAASYEYHGEKYAVFGRNNQPLVPEVCVDYLLDTLERASGTWWQPKDMPLGRSVGSIDFSSYDRTELRRVPQFVTFARQQAAWFDVLDIKQEERLPVGHEAIYAYLLQRHSDFRPGDMVLIGGYVPWEHRRITHYHSFFVYESDPMSGAPIMLSSNPGTPRLVSPEWEFRRTPKRLLLHRIRPRTEWLSRVVVDHDSELSPPPLSLPAR